MVIITKNKGDRVEVFQIEENVLERYRVGFAETVEGSGEKEAIDLYKMEYETCAKRYNDLYSAAWTNFSYMALFAGGILTFAGSRFVTPLTAFLACLPLLFWWIATFEPLNRYGDTVQKDLGLTEKALNELGISNLKNVGNDAKKGLSHFREFAGREPEEKSIRRSFIKWTFGLVFFLIALAMAFILFLELQFLSLRVVGLMAVVVFLVSLVLFLKFETKRTEDQGVLHALQQFIRVRFVVRISAAVLLITAICLGGKILQLYKSKQPLIVPKCQVSESESKSS